MTRIILTLLAYLEWIVFSLKPISCAAQKISSEQELVVPKVIDASLTGRCRSASHPNPFSFSQ